MQERQEDIIIKLSPTEKMVLEQIYLKVGKQARLDNPPEQTAAVMVSCGLR
jgi:hypothetical protein